MMMKLGKFRRIRVGRRLVVFLLVLGLLGAGGVMGWATQNAATPGSFAAPAAETTTAVVTEVATSTMTATATSSASAGLSSSYAVQFGNSSVLTTNGHLVVFDGRIALNVTNVPLSMQNLKSIAAKYNGYVSDSSLSPLGNNGSQAQVTIRVPSDKFDDAIDDVKKLGRLTSLETSSNDVTQNYVNLNARLESSMKLLAQYEKFLNETRNVSEALAVQANIDNIQMQIDLLTAQIQQLQKQVDFATIFISIFNQSKPVRHPSRNALDNSLGFAWAAASTEVSGLFFLTVGLSPLWVWFIPLMILIVRWNKGRQSRASQSAKTQGEGQ